MATVAQTIAFMRQRSPRVQFHLHAGDDLYAADYLDKGLADFAVMCEPASFINYHTRRLPEADAWGVYMRPDDPLAARESVRPADLVGRACYLSQQQSSLEHETSPFRNWLGEYHGQIAQAGTYDLVRNAIELTWYDEGALVIAFANLGANEKDGVVFRPFEPLLETSTVLAWKRHRTFGEAAQVFLNAMLDVLR